MLGCKLLLATSMQPFVFHTSKTIINEPGALSKLGEVCAKLGMKRPLVITDQGIVKLGMLEGATQSLATAGLAHSSFADVVADPPESIILAALRHAKQHDSDGVIGFGGGSSMDTAKLIALLLGSGEALADVYGVENARGPRLPLVLVPTTAGTGSEVTAIAIVTTGETTKTGVVSTHLYPDVALLDAELTLGLPPAITAATGIDAMVHAIEAYTSVIRKNPYSDMLAHEALRLMSKYLHRATQHGDDLEARQGMLFGACLAGQAFANAPVAAVHALAYPLGGHYHLPHGLTNALVLPAVLRFNAPVAGPLYAELAADVIPAAELADSTADRCQQFIRYMSSLSQDLGLQTSLRAVDVPEADLPMLARDALLQQRLLVNNPRPVSEADALAMYQEVYG